MNWHAHVTVATVIEDNGRFLLVEEQQRGRLVLNQPAGHLEPGESLIEAALRETLEETGWTVEIQGLVGVGLYTAPSNGVTYYRTTFFGRPLSHDAQRPLDTGIERALWLTPAEMQAEAERLRSPLVAKAVEHYLAGHRYPLSLIF
ncbi:MULTISPECIES: NUDIX hydrolase [Pseudomonas]|uniref:Phosphatase NudJ n=1 Tax=Pseudomonas flexibilis TaxID=706570 RepID=A0A0B3BWA0_9PSED|nr:MULTISPECIES: NUDIX hydrolase [Pseudomonas]KHL68431.1 NUDIX hydrolase [Pseudomonas flexibilis]KHO63652.1 NUDIX hydrolase [Pseudomonas flexibilis]SCY57685.1 ADP-ribose pyrophosphatase YjhB, NUDIX family [Pseudomonas flexibilis]SIR34908.1 ADP-ribose pyrophosphatase YjhB, NUDIX family [Pseudomonas flexibilis]